MGNDGGSIPTRRELVKEAAKSLTTSQLKESQQEQQEYAWTHDPITRKPLSRPVVSDSAGKLYNKDTILEYLLAGEDDQKKAEAERVLEGRVKSLKDVVEVKFQVQEGEVKEVNRASGGTGRTEKWVCPVTGTELGPGAKAVYVVPCGHAFAGSVVREVTEKNCLLCNEPYAENDVIPILATTEMDVAKLSLRAKTLWEKSLSHSLKKDKANKKRKHADREEANGATTVTDAITSNGNNNTLPKSKPTSSSESEQKSSRSDKPPKSKAALPPSATSNGIKNASTASLTAKVLEEQETLNKRRKLQQSENVSKLFSSRDNKPSAGNSRDYMNRGFSIPAVGAKK